MFKSQPLSLLLLSERFTPSIIRHAVLLGLILVLIQAVNPVNGRLLAVTMIYAIAAIGLNVTLGMSGLVSLAQAGFIGLGAYSWALLSQATEMDFIPALILSVALCAGVGFLVGALATRIRTHYFIVVTIGVQVTFLTLINQLDDLTGGSQGMAVTAPLDLAGFEVKGLSGLLAVIAVAFVLAFFTANRLRASRDGLALMAIFNSGQGAEAVGMNARLYRSVGMAIGSGFGGLAGCLFAPFLKYLGPESFGLELSILLVVMIVVGGLGSNIGAVVGVAVLTQVNHYAQSTLGLSNLFYGLILILAVLLAPRGLAGLVTQTYHAIRRRTSRGATAGDGATTPERNLR